MVCLKPVHGAVDEDVLRERAPSRILERARSLPFEDHTETGLMAGIDEGGEVLAIAMPGRRREQPRACGDLLQRVPSAGGAADLHVGESECGHIGGQSLAQRAPVGGAVLLRLPCVRFDAIDRDGRRAIAARAADGDEPLVTPRMFQRSADNRGRAGRQFGAARHGIHDELAGLRALFAHGETISGARMDARHEQFPHARVGAQAHGMAPVAPFVEIARDRNARRMRRPQARNARPARRRAGRGGRRGCRRRRGRPHRSGPATGRPKSSAGRSTGLRAPRCARASRCAARRAIRLRRARRRGRASGSGRARRASSGRRASGLPRAMRRARSHAEDDRQACAARQAR